MTRLPIWISSRFFACLWGGFFLKFDTWPFRQSFSWQPLALWLLNLSISGKTPENIESYFHTSCDFRWIFGPRDTMRNADFSVQHTICGITIGIRVSVCDGLNYKPILRVSQIHSQHPFSLWISCCRKWILFCACGSRFLHPSGNAAIRKCRVEVHVSCKFTQNLRDDSFFLKFARFPFHLELCFLVFS